MRRAYPDRRTVEGRALNQLQIAHALYRQGRDDRIGAMWLHWRQESRKLAWVISGRHCFGAL
jgi:hypothetical protein